MEQVLNAIENFVDGAMKFSGTMASERSRAKAVAQRHAGGTVELAARIGYGAKGLVYGTLGVLAAMTAFGFSGGQIIGARGGTRLR